MENIQTRSTEPIDKNEPDSDNIIQNETLAPQAELTETTATPKVTTINDKHTNESAKDHHDDASYCIGIKNSISSDINSSTSQETKRHQHKDESSQHADNCLAPDVNNSAAASTTTVSIKSNDATYDSVSNDVVGSDESVTPDQNVATSAVDTAACLASSPSSTTLPDESTSNASTEVHLDASISDRLANLSIGADESGQQQAKSTNTSVNDSSTGSSSSINHCNSPLLQVNNNEELTVDSTPVVACSLSTRVTIEHSTAKTLSDDDGACGSKPERSAELSRSILAGEVSDNSECSVEIDDDEDEPSDYDDDKVVSGNVSDEEMFIEDQEEEVEEEEEFHEVEEEKHKTSQESVGGDKVAVTSPRTKTRSSPVKENQQQQVLSEPVAGDSTCATVSSKSSDSPTTEESKSQEKAESPKPRLADWADIMASKRTEGDEGPSGHIVLAENNGTVVSGQESNEQENSKDGEQEKTDEAEKKELDLDEDVKNPQYIPKKGVFYEHDDRSHDSSSKKQLSTSVKKDEEVCETKESANSRKTGITQDKPNENRRGNRRQRAEADRWNHDLYKDDKQKPKSKSELIHAYGYDIRHDRTARNHTDNRPARGSHNNNNVERQNPQPSQGTQENQRYRQNRDNRAPRQSQPANRSRERRPRRQNNNTSGNSSSNNNNNNSSSSNNNNNRGRTETPGTLSKRDFQNSRSIKPESKEIKHDVPDAKQGFQNSPTQSTIPSSRRDLQDGVRDRSTRPDNRSRRQTSKDRPTSNSADDKLPPINTVMPPITTWSNKIEDMVKEEASRKESSPPRHQHPQHHHQGINHDTKNRSNDYWPQNQQIKNIHHDRSVRNIDDNRLHQQQQPQQYNARRFQDRDDNHKPAQYVNRNHYNDRSNLHHQEWRRGNNYNSAYAKPNEFEPIKTQTFENSRLSQTNMNRSNIRDAREIINERRIQQQQQQHQQQNLQSKVQQGPLCPQDHQLQQQRQLQHQHQQQLFQQHHHLLQHQHQLLQHPQQPSQHLRQQQAPPQPSQQQPPQGQQAPQQQQPQQSQSSQPPQTPHTLQGQRQSQHSQQQPQASQPQQQHSGQQRQSLAMNNMNDDVQESSRLNSSASNANDLINSRPIIKTDAYTGTSVATHSQQIQQHSQNHRSLGPMSQQQGPGSAGSHMVPSHLGAGSTQAQYYTSASSRDSAVAAAALASAYHGYLPSGHSVLDTTRYHMNSQQLTDHSYMTSPGQTNDVAAASVLHPQGMYTDAASAGGTVASSAYLAQAGSTLSSSTNIPVTGAGPPPLAPVSYLHQHSQYPPPNPYSNPYSQPQHNQAPPQSSHAYPFWTPYI